MVLLIAGMGKNRVIGCDGGVPWKLPAEAKRFEQLTAGHPVIMGRKTFESIGRPLPNRTNIIITRQPAYSVPGSEVVSSFEEALARAHRSPGNKEIFIIGGGEIYKQAMDSADRIYLTVVEKDFEGDTYFPNIDETRWKRVSNQKGIVDSGNILPHTFLAFERIPDSE